MQCSAHSCSVGVWLVYQRRNTLRHAPMLFTAVSQNLFVPQRPGIDTRSLPSVVASRRVDLIAAVTNKCAINKEQPEASVRMGAPARAVSDSDVLLWLLTIHIHT